MIRIKFLKDIPYTGDNPDIQYYAREGSFGWILDINPDYCIAYADVSDRVEFRITYEDYEIVYRYVGSTVPNVDTLPKFTAAITYPAITDNMVEQCAKAMERTRLSKRDLSDEEFDAWWEGSVKFTDRELLLKSVRAGLETVLLAGTIT